MKRLDYITLTARKKYLEKWVEKLDPQVNSERLDNYNRELDEIETKLEEARKEPLEI